MAYQSKAEKTLIAADVRLDLNSLTLLLQNIFMDEVE